MSTGDGSAAPLAPLVAQSLVRFGGGFCFTTPPAQATDAALWRSDGSPSHTEPIATFTARAGGSPTVGPLFAGDGVLFFGVAWPGSTELWRSDGTAAGTAMVARLDATMAPTVKRAITQAAFLDGVLLFSFPSRPGHEGSPNLWRSDGTEQGTKPITAVPPFRQVSNFARFGDRIAFHSPYQFSYLWDGQALGVWITDGTEAGTRQIFDGAVARGTLLAAGDALYFCGVPSTEIFLYEPYLFRSDGTAAETQPLPGRHVVCHGELAAGGNSLFVPSTNQKWGDELWAVPLAPP